MSDVKLVPRLDNVTYLAIMMREVSRVALLYQRKNKQGSGGTSSNWVNARTNCANHRAGADFDAFDFPLIYIWNKIQNMLYQSAW